MQTSRYDGSFQLMYGLYHDGTGCLQSAPALHQNRPAIPLARKALEHIATLAVGNTELGTGERGARKHVHVEGRLLGVGGNGLEHVADAVTVTVKVRHGASGAQGRTRVAAGNL